MFVQEWEEDFCSADEEQFMSEMGTIHPPRATNNTTYNKNKSSCLSKCLPCSCLTFPSPAPFPAYLDTNSKKNENMPNGENISFRKT